MYCHIAIRVILIFIFSYQIPFIRFLILIIIYYTRLISFGIICIFSFPFITSNPFVFICRIIIIFPLILFSKFSFKITFGIINICYFPSCFRVLSRFLNQATIFIVCFYTSILIITMFIVFPNTGVFSLYRTITIISNISLSSKQVIWIMFSVQILSYKARKCARAQCCHHKATNQCSHQILS